jgi:hypothetical protein
MVIDPSDLVTLLYAQNTYYRMRGTVSNTSSVNLYIGGVPIPQNHPQFGWTLQRDEYTYGGLDNDPRKKIVFNRPFRFANTVIEMDYITTPAYCRKCRGYTYKNDFTLSTNRSFLHITEHPKLMQRVLKMLLTSSCQFYPSLTCPIKDLVGKKLGTYLTEDDIKSFASDSVSNIQTIQNAQKSIQNLVPQEILKDILDVSVVTDQNDPSRIRVAIQVSSYGDDRPQPLAFTLTATR